MGRALRCDKNGLIKGPWTPEEDKKLIDYIQKHGYGNWRTLPKSAGKPPSIHLPVGHHIFSLWMNYSTSYGLYADGFLKSFVIGLQRCGKSCRLRWTNYLRPDIKRGRFSFEEEETIIQLHSILGNK